MYLIRIAPDYHVQFWVTTSAAPPFEVVFHLVFPMPTLVSSGHLQSML